MHQSIGILIRSCISSKLHVMFVVYIKYHCFETCRFWRYPILAPTLLAVKIEKQKVQIAQTNVWSKKTWIWEWKHQLFFKKHFNCCLFWEMFKNWSLISARKIHSHTWDVRWFVHSFPTLLSHANITNNLSITRQRTLIKINETKSWSINIWLQ